MRVIWLRRIVYRGYRVVSALRHWVGRRLTRTGIGVFCGAVASLALGIDTDRTAAVQAFAVLSSMLLVSLAFGWRFRGRFAVERVLPRFGTVGQPLHYAVLVDNLTSKTQHGLSMLEQLPYGGPSFEEFVAMQRARERRMRSFTISRKHPLPRARSAMAPEAPVPTVAPGQRARVQAQVVPRRRGVLRFDSVLVARMDPLGLFRAFSRQRCPGSVLILPHRYRLSTLALPGAVKYQQGGVALASSIGQSEEFISLRDYRSGDPLRHMHWRSWAKLEKPIVKEYQDEYFVRHALVLDTFTDDPMSELFEEAVSVASSFACAMQTQESLLDLLFVGPQAYKITSGRGLAHADQMLEVLAAVRHCPSDQFGTLSRLVLDHASLLSGCILVFLAWDEPRRELVRKLKTMNLPLKVYVVTEAAHPTLEPGPMAVQPDGLVQLKMGNVAQTLEADAS